MRSSRFQRALSIMVDNKQGNIGLVIGEGQGSIFQRCEAWCSAHNLNIEDIPLYVSKQPINIREPELVQAIIDEFKPIGNLAIVIDTLARNFGGGNENASDMGQFINACDTIILWIAQWRLFITQEKITRWRKGT